MTKIKFPFASFSIKLEQSHYSTGVHLANLLLQFKYSRIVFRTSQLEEKSSWSSKISPSWNDSFFAFLQYISFSICRHQDCQYLSQLVLLLTISSSQVYLYGILWIFKYLLIKNDALSNYGIARSIYYIRSLSKDSLDTRLIWWFSVHTQYL